MPSLLSKLLPRVAYLAIENGRICLRPKSNDIATSERWLKNNEDQLLIDILAATDRCGYLYMGYSTGYYNGAGKAGGLALLLINPVSKKRGRISYNVGLKRTKNGPKYKKGDRLPNKRFIAPKGGAFVQLWRSAGLKDPHRFSDFHDYMGKLKGVIFSGEYVETGAKKETFKPMSISFEEIISSRQNQAKLPDKNPTATRQKPDKNPTRTRQDAPTRKSTKAKKHGAFTEVQVRVPIGAKLRLKV